MDFLGANIRRLRTLQRRTLREIAEACGFTPSLLSKIETGRSVPPISTLSKIAKSLGVRVSALLDEGNERGTLFYAAGAVDSRLIPTSKGYSFFAYAQERGDKLFQPYLFIARRDEVTKSPLSHTGQEFIYMLEGEMKYRIAGSEYLLTPGATLYFDSTLEHDLEPISEEVKYLGIFSEQDDGRRAAASEGSDPQGSPSSPSQE